MAIGGRIARSGKRRWFGPARLRPEATSGEGLSEMVEYLRKRTGLDHDEAARVLVRLGQPQERRAA
jgi:hypothetical protein